MLAPREGTSTGLTTNANWRWKPKTSQGKNNPTSRSIQQVYRAKWSDERRLFKRKKAFKENERVEDIEDIKKMVHVL